LLKAETSLLDGVKKLFSNYFNKALTISHFSTKITATKVFALAVLILTKKAELKSLLNTELVISHLTMAKLSFYSYTKTTKA